MSKLARRSRNRPKKNPSSSPRHNPPLFTDMLEMAVPGAIGFASTRLITKLSIAAVAKRWPSKSRHVGALLATSTFLATWFLGHRVKMLEKYHVPITVGSAIAAAINVLQIYLPKIGWLVGDPTELTAGGTSSQKLAAAGGAQAQLPGNLEEIDDDPAFYTYNDAYDAGRYAANAGNKQQPSQPAAQELLEGEDFGGVFAGGLAAN